MPSPSLSSVKSDLAVNYTVEGGFPTSIVLNGNFDTKMANGIVNGWTVSAPTTPSTFETEIISAFGSYVGGAGSLLGLQWITCVGQELDAEVDLWIASWNTTVHTYTPSSSAIIGRIETCQPFSSAATTALNSAIAGVFISNFGQETA